MAALGDILDFLRLRNPGASRKVAEAIRAAINRLVDHPRSGRMQSDGSRKLVVLPYAYVVLYDVQLKQELVLVLTIYHPAQQRRTTDI